MNSLRTRRLIVSLLTAVGLVAGLVVVPTTPASAAGVHVAPTSIDATGKTDVTTALVTFFESVPDGATITFPAGARYRVEGVMVFEDRQGLTIDGTGATFVVTTDGTSATEGKDHDWWGRLWPRKRGQFVFNGGRDLTIRNLSIVGPNTGAGAHNESYVVDLEAQHGVEFFGTTDSVLEDCTIRNTYGDLVSVSGASRNIAIRGCTLTHSGRQGITVDRAESVLIEDNDLSEIGRSTIDLEPAHPSWVVDGVTIARNRVGEMNGAFVAAYGTGPVDNVVVHANRVIGDEMKVLVKDSKGAPRKNWTITDNFTDSIFGSPVAPMRFTKVDNIVITGNRQRIASTQSRQAVAVREATSVRIEGNDYSIINTRDQTKPATGETGGIEVNGVDRTQPIMLGTPTPVASGATPSGGSGGGAGTFSAPFVSAVYRDFLGREPTAGELSALAPRATTAEGRRTIAVQLAYSDEWVGAMVDRFYRDTLDRSADAAGRAHWVDIIRRKAMTPTQVASAFYASQEYFSTKGGSSTAQWLDQLYDALLGRPADSGGRAHWDRIAGTSGRQAVTGPFYDSAETLRVRIDALYEELLGRPADPSGLAHWSQKVRSSGSDVELAVLLTSSEEYLRRAGA